MLKVGFLGELTGIPIAREKRNAKFFKNNYSKENVF